MHLESARSYQPPRLRAFDCGSGAGTPSLGSATISTPFIIWHGTGERLAAGLAKT